MQTLFSSNIAEEKERLIQALSKIPPSTTEQLINARTHIAFKRNTSGDVRSEPAAGDDMTFTVSKRSSFFLGGPKIRKLFDDCDLPSLSLF